MNRAAQRGGKVSLALIGCGAIAERMFLPVLAGHEGVQIVSLVDRDVERARRLANGYGVEQVLRDVSELSADRVEAAIVATPPFHHAPASIALIKQGIHVLVEKPIALNTTEAEAMVEAADAANVVLAVGYFRRLFPSIRLMKGGLDGGLWGRALSFEVEGGGIYSWPAVTLDNMRRDLAGGGVLIDFGSHLVDLLCYLFDEPAEVLSYRDNALGGVESDCSIELRVQHRGTPIQGSVELARTRGVGNLIRVCCERATVEFQLNERYRLRVRPHDSQARDLFVGRSREYWLEAGWERETEEPSWYATFRWQIDDFIDAIRNKRTPALAARTALPTTRLIERCYAVRQAMSEPWVMHGLLAGSLEAAQAGSAGETANVRSSHTRQLVSPRRRRVLVTGATGFIGGRVAEVLALRDGWDVRALVHTPANASRLARLPVEMVQSDLSSAESVERLVEGCDAVVHCAIGTEWGQRSRILEVTVDGTRRVAEAALKAELDLST